MSECKGEYSYQALDVFKRINEVDNCILELILYLLDYVINSVQIFKF